MSLVAYRGKPPTHVDVIDVIRGLAAMTVAFYHIREVLWVGMREFLRSGPPVALSSALSFMSMPFIWGAIGVPIFFVLSGYVIHRRAARDMIEGRGGDFSVGTFLLRRFIRIYPTFLAALLLTFLCDAISQQYTPLNNKLGDMSLTALMVNMLALNGLLAPSFGSNGALWTLAIEIQFYAIYPLALMLRRRIGMDWMLVFAILLSVVGALTLETNGLQAFPSYYFSWWIGAYVADREAAGRSLIPLGWLWGALFIALGCAMVVMKFDAYYGHTAWSLGFAFILEHILRKGWGQKGNRGIVFKIFSWIGNFSYSLYAIHLPIVVLIGSVLFGAVHQPSIYVPIIAFIFILLAAYLFYLMVEKPSARLLQKMSRPV